MERKYKSAITIKLEIPWADKEKGLVQMVNRRAASQADFSPNKKKSVCVCERERVRERERE